MIDDNFVKLYEQHLSEAFASKKNISISADEFNKGIDHILDLLEAAVELYCLKKYNISAFLAISVMEEKVKIEVYSYGSYDEEKSENSDNDKNRKRGVLYNHKFKHSLAPSPVISMSNRLKEAMGEDGINELTTQSMTQGFVAERESALYIDFRDDGTIIFPREIITQKTARNLLLFAIEIVDDGLIGLTEYSLNEVSPHLDHLWNTICENG